VYGVGEYKWLEMAQNQKCLGLRGSINLIRFRIKAFGAEIFKGEGIRILETCTVSLS
jgi:hypothetical protein